jgi:hypothetical protein
MFQKLAGASSSSRSTGVNTTAVCVVRGGKVAQFAQVAVAARQHCCKHLLLCAGEASC